MPALAVILPLLLAALVVAGAWAVWRWPAVALPVFVLGLALHNFLLMWLVALGEPTSVVRAIQSWKELYLGVLGVRLAWHVIMSGGILYLRRALAEWSRLPVVPRAFDVAMVAFAAVLVAYLVLPSPPLPQPTPTIAQRLVSFRTLMLIPALYLFGRVWPPTQAWERRLIGTSVVLVAALVSVAGLIELWFVPTRLWVDMGIVRFDLFLGFNYGGPGGLPSNFFQSTTTGLALRRMVSTYLSPLGIAYTGLLVVPLAVAGALAARRHRAWMWAAFTLIVIGISLSVTRLALLCLAGEAILLAGTFRRPVVVAACSFALIAVAAAVFVYPDYGPIVDFKLADVRPPAGARLLGIANPPGLPGAGVPTASAAPSDVSGDIVSRMASGDDASIQAHVAALRAGSEFVVAHPFGIGLGASVSRFGSTPGPNESAFFQIGGEVGLPGLIPFVFIYGGLILVGGYMIWDRRADPEETALPVVMAIGGLGLAPIVVTSQVWGDFSVTFLFWWLAGSCIAAWPRTRSQGQRQARLTNSISEPQERA